MTVQPPAERPAPGYYPDPSIPGFVRYWDGDAWTPGSARPAPEDGAPLPPPPRAARGGVRVAPPPPPRPAGPEETGPVFLDETGAARLTVPPAPELPEFPRTPSGPQLLPTAEEAPSSSVWTASPQAQPGLLDTGPVPRHVSWGVPTPPAEVDPDEELASALRLALSQTRRAQLPPPDHYVSSPEPSRTPPPGGGWAPPTSHMAAPPAAPTESAPPADADALEDTGAWPSAAARSAAPPAAPVWTPRADRAPDRKPWSSEAASAAQPSDRAPTAAPGAGTVEDTGGWAAPATGPAAQPAAAVWTPRADRAPDRKPWSSEAASAAQPAVPDRAPAREARPTAASGTVQDTGGWALPATRPAAQPPGGATSVGRAPAQPAQPTREASGASRSARAEGAAPVGAKAPRRGKGKGARPALLGPRIGARLVDTVVTYALVGVLAVVLVQRVTLHLQAKIDAAQASGVPQTVWLVDGTVLANAGLLLAALLAVGLVYETIPLAVWGRTLGKAMFGLTVLDARSKARPRLGRTFLRTAMCQTLVFLLLGILELVPCATDRKLRQSWHDKLGATFVAKQGG